MKAGADVLGMTVKADDGRRLGTVTDLLFDDRCSRVVGFVTRCGYVFRTCQVVGFSEVQEIGPSAVVVSDASQRSARGDEASAIRTDRRSMQGKAVVTRQGRYLGTVRDVLFDEANGRVLALEVADPETRGKLGRRAAVPAHLTYVIPDGVVISDAPLAS